ncbi:aldehyde dehydrogenase family protein [Natronorubrum daqingense]|uniref:Aldehyde dehydrogenase n=1 Tax=Natronorubrum daqingense TaxID=588898 RepID=A0A1N7ERN9_9EURY|nr:aldehyde dehydrogenase family protein [Natronorubrum daqingense]APX97764.1 aldehyde dehydrogenase [Natronorubrum daqingense]SIR90714.1 aldehyde dehydrogenase (NAD+) [Natronorubrum daqingense]
MATHSANDRDQYGLFIDGTESESASGETISVVDPATEEPFTSIQAGSASDVDRAVDAALEGQTEWYGLAPAERGRILRRASDLIADRRDELARLLTRENGKPISQARTEIDAASRYFEYYSGMADKIQGETIPLGREYVDYTIQEPLGVTGHIIPWNFPAAIFGRTVAPALTAGNAVVVKPAEQTPLTALEFAQILDEAGAPSGTVNVVTGYGVDAGEPLTEHEDVSCVAFTGSVETGKAVAAAAGRQLTPAHIEAGGKNPNVVFPDADLEQAVEQTLISIFTRNAGQVCSAGDRLIVHEDIREAFLERLVEEVESLEVGTGLDDPDIGPLVSEAQYETVSEYIEIGSSEVGEPIVGGAPEETEDGYFVEPTVFDGASNDDRISQEEIFGPVLTVIPFSTEAEAIELANDSEYGLTAGIFTTDLERAHRFARDVVAGQVYVNEWFAGGVETPFGGFRESGFGREKGLEAVEQFTATKNVGLKIGDGPS